MNPLEKRIVDISYRHKLTHVSSCLNTVNVIDYIYAVRKPNDPFVLGNSHAALALFVVLEKHRLCDAEDMVNRYGTHAARDMDRGVWVSGGSLGQAETVAVGMALANKGQTVWLVTSDGACAEGSVSEVFRCRSLFRLHNLEIHIICNGFGAYGPAFPLPYHDCRLHWVKDRLPSFLSGLAGHYLTLNAEQHAELMA